MDEGEFMFFSLYTYMHAYTHTHRLNQTQNVLDWMDALKMARKTFKHMENVGTGFPTERFSYH